MSGKGLMRIGELAKLCGFTTRSIRYYEELGLIRPAARSTASYRLYNNIAKMRLDYIQRLTQVGLTLTDIQKLFSVWEASRSGDERRQRLEEVIAEHLKEISRRRRALDIVERELHLILSTVVNCKECQLVPEIDTCGTCPTITELEESPEIVAVWSR